MEITTVKLNKVDEPREDIRSQITEEGLEELAQSIQTLGLLHEPVLVRRNKRYEVAIGNRRVLAAKMLGWEEIPAKVVAKAEFDADLAKFHENVYREDVSPFEEAKWLNYLKQKLSCTNMELAQQVSRSVEWVRRRLTSFDWPDFLKEAVNDRVISFDVAAELYTLHDEQEERRLLQYAIDQGANANLIRDWVRQSKREKKAREAAQDVLKEYGRRVTVEGGPPVSQDEVRRQVEEWQGDRGPRSLCHFCRHYKLQEKMINIEVCDECLTLLQQAFEQTKPVED